MKCAQWPKELRLLSWSLPRTTNCCLCCRQILIGRSVGPFQKFIFDIQHYWTFTSVVGGINLPRATTRELNSYLISSRTASRKHAIETWGTKNKSFSPVCEIISLLGLIGTPPKTVLEDSMLTCKFQIHPVFSVLNIVFWILFITPLCKIIFTSPFQSLVFNNTI